MSEIPEVVGGEPVESAWGNTIRDRTVQRYADETARDASVLLPISGDLAYLVDTATITYYDGAVWQELARLSELDGVFVLKAGDVMTGLLTAPAVNLSDNSEGSGGVRWANIRRLAFGATASFYDADNLLRARWGEAASSGYVERLYATDGTTVLAEVTDDGIVRGRGPLMPSLVETFPRGTLLDSAYLSDSLAPGGSATNLLTHTVTLEYPSQPVIVDVVGMLRSSDMGDGDGFQASVNIDGSGFANARMAVPAMSGGSHTHNVEGSTVTGSASGHLHTIAIGQHNHGSRSVSVSASGGEMTATCFGFREFTPGGSSFDINLVGEIRAGAPASWFESMRVLVYRA